LRATLISVMSQTAADLKTVPLVKVPRELLASPGFLLAKIGMAIKTRAMAGFDEAGFDPFHYSILALLAEGERETQATIADAVRVDRSRLVGILDGLEARGLIQRRRDEHDRRRHVVSLTEEGKSSLVRLRSLVKGVEDEFLSPLDAESRATLHALLLELASYHDPRCGPDDQVA
jgi:DNA-binding MarR family transcriptional regulator